MEWIYRVVAVLSLACTPGILASFLTSSFSLARSFCVFIARQMGFLGDAANKAAEDKVYAEGGYPALWKYRIVRLAHQVQTCSCCS